MKLIPKSTFFKLQWQWRQATAGFILLLVLGGKPTRAQEVRVYGIGDTLPDLFFREVVNHSSRQARLSDFKGKLVLLDYWATWCAPCVGAFPKLEALSKRFRDSLQVIGVTKESSQAVDRLFARMKAMGQQPILSVLNDDYLFRLFPHYLIPHYVWISDKRVVMAITDAHQVTEANIEWALNSLRGPSR